MPPEAVVAENWTVQDVSRFLRVTERAINTYVKKGKIPPPRKFGGRLLWDASKIRALLDAAGA